MGIYEICSYTVIKYYPIESFDYFCYILFLLSECVHCLSHENTI